MQLHRLNQGCLLFPACCSFIHCLAQTCCFLGSFSDWLCYCLTSVLLFEPSSCFHMIFVCVLLKGSFRSLQVTLLSLSSPAPVQSPLNHAYACSAVLCWLDVGLLAVMVSSQSGSRMPMRRKKEAADRQVHLVLVTIEPQIPRHTTSKGSLSSVKHPSMNRN